MGDGRKPSAGTLERGLSVLEFFAEEGEASASGVVESLGLSRSATYRILDMLKQRQYLEVNPVSKKLRLGVKAVELGMAALSEINVVRLAPQYLQDLVESTRETVFLAVADGDAMVYVYKEEGPQAIKMSSQLGSRRPIYCTALGKAYMAALPDAVLTSLLGTLDLRRFTANTITDVATLEAEILTTRERGYAVDRVEVEEGVACCGAALRDHRGLPVAAISVAGPADRILPQEDTIGPLVARTASVISKRLGFLGG